MCHTTVSATKALSVTRYIWKHGTKENNSILTLNKVVYTKTSIFPMEYLMCWFVDRRAVFYMYYLHVHVFILPFSAPIIDNIQNIL